VVRREKKGIRRYVHIGTGNYNASSAKIYTDLSLFTADEAINADVTDLFNVMTGCGHIEQYRKLFVSPHSMRPNLVKKIEEEVEFHRQQGNGHIVLKCNQLVDPQVIEALYKASQAGVRIDCVVRGICCLRPGVKGLSENITVKSIVGRYLEHARIYWFNHGGDHKMYIGSADLMNRNLSGRIEVVSPIENPKIQAKLFKNIVKMQLEDTQQTWIMNSDGSYTRYKAAAGVKKVDAQNAENHHNPLY
jgi:polyphosphate kinase